MPWRSVLGDGCDRWVLSTCVLPWELGSQPPRVSPVPGRSRGPQAAGRGRRRSSAPWAGSRLHWLKLAGTRMSTGLRGASGHALCWAWLGGALSAGHGPRALSRCKRRARARERAQGSSYGLCGRSEASSLYPESSAELSERHSRSHRQLQPGVHRSPVLWKGQKPTP